MKKKHTLVWLVPLILLLLLIPFLVPSALPYAGAEETELPVYAPVELTNPHPEPLLPLPSVLNPPQSPTPYAPHASGYGAFDEKGVAWEYRDGTIYVKIETAMVGVNKVFFTWVQVADPSQIRCHVTKAENNPLAESRKVSAVLALNGDFYSGRKEGIIYRNGELMRPKKPFGNYDALIIDNEGDFHILSRPEDNAFDPYLDSIIHSFLFGPGLVINGELQTFEGNNYGSGPGMGLTNKTQRQVFCQMGKLSYLIITTQGPKDKSDKVHGCTMEEVAQIAYDMGAINAYNLDGGNSAHIIMNGIRMNRSGYREMTDLIYFITAEPEPEPDAPEAEAAETETP